MRAHVAYTRTTVKAHLPNTLTKVMGHGSGSCGNTQDIVKIDGSDLKARDFVNPHVDQNIDLFIVTTLGLVNSELISVFKLSKF